MKPWESLSDASADSIDEAGQTPHAVTLRRGNNPEGVAGAERKHSASDGGFLGTLASLSERHGRVSEAMGLQSQWSTIISTAGRRWPFR